MFNPRIFKATAVAAPMAIVPTVVSGIGWRLYWRWPYLAVPLFVLSGVWVFCLALYASYEFVDSFWSDE